METPPPSRWDSLSSSVIENKIVTDIYSQEKPEFRKPGKITITFLHFYFAFCLPCVRHSMSLYFTCLGLLRKKVKTDGKKSAVCSLALFFYVPYESDWYGVIKMG